MAEMCLSTSAFPIVEYQDHEENTLKPPKVSVLYLQMTKLLETSCHILKPFLGPKEHQN